MKADITFNIIQRTEHDELRHVVEFVLRDEIIIVLIPWSKLLGGKLHVYVLKYW